MGMLFPVSHWGTILKWTPHNLPGGIAAGTWFGGFGSGTIGGVPFSRFVITRQTLGGGVTPPAIYTSTNGQTWTAASSVPSTLSDIVSPSGYFSQKLVAFGNGIFVSVGWYYPLNTTVTPILTSPDGLTWTAVNILGVYGGAVTIGGIVFTNGRFVLIGDDGGALYGCFTSVSTDGVTWSAPQASSVSYHTKLSAANNLFFLSNTNFTANMPVYTSSDGLTWTLRNMDTISGRSYYVEYYSSLFFITVNTTPNRWYTSPDAITWTGRSSGSLAPNQLASGNKGIVTSSATLAATSYRTTDGLTLSSVPGLTDSISDITYGNGIYMGCGAVNTVFTLK